MTSRNTHPDSATMQLPHLERASPRCEKDEWVTRQLSEIATVKTGKRNNEDKIANGRYPFFVRSATVERINSYYHDGEAILVPGEGRIGEVLHYTKGRFDVHQRVYAITHFDTDVSAKFIYYYMALSFGKWAMQNSVKAAVDSLRLPTFLRFEMQLPSSRKTQATIVDVLSDVDRLLESLDELIAKKRAIKHATMSALLAGRTRLPGFSGKWETQSLGSIADARGGTTPRTDIARNWNGTISWSSTTDVTGATEKFLIDTARRITSAGLTSCRAAVLPAGTLLLCTRATIGDVRIAEIPVCPGQGVTALVCRETVSNEFIYYLLKTLSAQMIERAVGSTFLQINKPDLVSLNVCLPSRDEQDAIASVLSSMDSEIVALERRRDKTLAIKQGMMQQLLTGRTRLPASA